MALATAPRSDLITFRLVIKSTKGVTNSISDLISIGFVIDSTCSVCTLSEGRGEKR